MIDERIEHNEYANIFLPTKFPDLAKATLITHADLSGMTCTLFPVHVSQMISLPSREPVTECLQNKHKESISTQYYIADNPKNMKNPIPILYSKLY